MNIYLKNSFIEEKTVYVQKNTEAPIPIEAGNRHEFSLDNPGAYLKIWAEKSGEKVFCSFKLVTSSMSGSLTPKTDTFTSLPISFSSDEKQWTMAKLPDGQTNVNVSVGDDDQ